MLRLSYRLGLIHVERLIHVEWLIHVETVIHVERLVHVERPIHVDMLTVVTHPAVTPSCPESHWAGSASGQGSTVACWPDCHT